MRRTAVVLLASWVLTSAFTSQTQRPTRDAAPGTTEPGSGVLSGRVVAQDGSPVARARITLAPVESPNRWPQWGLTDGNGTFSFPRLPAGRYALEAAKPAFMTTAYGANRPGRPGAVIPIADGERVSNISIVLPRGSVIAGTVRDWNGDPAANTQIRAVQVRATSGGLTLAASAGGAKTTTSDDRGVYRFYGLGAGNYVIVATPRLAAGSDVRQVTEADVESALRGTRPAEGTTAASAMAPSRETGPIVGYSPVYYPGTTLGTNAMLLTLAAGEERSGIDFSLELVPMARLEGNVTTTDGSLPPTGGQVTLLSTDKTSFALGLLSANVTAASPSDGRFAFTGIAPGQYTLTATVGQSTSTFSATSQWGATEITVDGHDLSGVTVSVQPGATLVGRVALEGIGASAPDLSRIRVTLNPVRDVTQVTFGAGATETDSAGQFRFAGVIPGRYRLGVSVPPAIGFPGAVWTIKSVFAGGRDVSDLGLEIGGRQDIPEVAVTLSDRVAELSGRLLDVAGAPTPDYSVLAFSTNRDSWGPQSRRVVAARPGTEGLFRFPGLPPGEYFLTAVTDVEPSDWADPAFLEELVPTSIRVTVGEGEKKIQDIRLAGRGQAHFDSMRSPIAGRRRETYQIR